MGRLPAIYLPSSLENWPQRLSFLFLAGSVSLALVSIAASQILLSAAIIEAIVRWRRQGRLPGPPAAVLLPLLVFFIWTVAAALLGPGSLHDSHVRKFWLFSVLLIVPISARDPKCVIYIYRAIFAVAAVSAAAGLGQFIINPNRDLMHRIQGFMSHMMTFSGSLMLVLVALAAYVVVFGWKRHYWVLPLGLALAAALYLSETRSALGGAVAGIAAILLLLKRLRIILGLAALLLALYLVSPASIQQRLRGALNPADINTRNRIELFGTGLRLIRAHPWVGVGTNVDTEAPKYRGTQEFPVWMYIHLHNNFLQIAAERGLPGLILWLWFMAQLGWQAFRSCRASRSPGAAGPGNALEDASFVASAAIGGWVALLAAGMFEYNFGDSEVLTLFLFMMSAPCTAKK